MLKVISAIILLLLITLYGASFVMGREATVWTVSDAIPATMRTFTAGVLQGLTRPIGAIEDMSGMRFGPVATNDDLVACGASNACMREIERFLPEKSLVDFKGQMEVSRGGCTFTAAISDPHYMPTRVSLLIDPGRGREKVFTTAVLAAMAVGGSPQMAYAVEPEGCEATRTAGRDFSWELLWAKGLTTIPDKPSEAPKT